jgi:hypothetical protein
LHDTKAGLVKTRKEIEKEIVHGKQTIEKYQHIIKENEDKIHDKVFKMLQENHFIPKVGD